MADTIYSQSDLDHYQRLLKVVKNPKARWHIKPKSRPSHRQKNHRVIVQDDKSILFGIYLRQSLEKEHDFSCGIRLILADGSSLVLARYNGSGHAHKEIMFKPHIHMATEETIASGKGADSHAEETDRYETLEGALACLTDDFMVSGMKAHHDAPKLRYDD